MTAITFEGYCCLEWQMYTYGIVREYHVLGHGMAKASELDVVQRILDTKTAQVAENGRPAQSHIRFIADTARDRSCSEAFCHVSIRIHTGRRHQIRVHMRYCDCVSVTDSRYSPGPTVLLRPGCIRKLQEHHVCFLG